MSSFIFSEGLKIVEVPKSMTFTLLSKSSLSKTKFSGFKSLFLHYLSKIPMYNMTNMTI